MSNITNIIDVQRVNDEYKVIINIISEILQKIKYMNNNIEKFKSDNHWFSKCVVTKDDKEIEQIGGGTGKKLAQRRAALKILATLLQYNLPSNYDDGCY